MLRSGTYIVAFFATLGCASASTVQVINTKQLAAPVIGASVRFTMPTGWHLQRVRTNEYEKTIVPITRSRNALIHIYPLRDPLHTHSQSDFAQGYLSFRLSSDATATMQRRGSVQTDHYGPVGLYHYRMRHSPTTECLFSVVTHGATYVKIELCTPEAAGTITYEQTLRDLIRHLIVNDI